MNGQKAKMPAYKLLLLAAALLLLVSVGLFTVTGARAQLTARSDDYNASFELNHLQVHLLENGKDVCGEKNTVDGEKVTGELLGYLKGEDGAVVQPGRAYREEIAARNSQSTPQYVRLIVYKYWTDKDGNKTQVLDPALIQLSYGDQEYNSGAWQRNDKESTPERSVYYLSSQLPAGTDSALLFDTFRVDDKVMEGDNVVTDKIDETHYTYHFKYEGYQCNIKAEVQAIQTDHADEAVESIWGVPNVTVEGGSLVVE